MLKRTSLGYLNSYISKKKNWKILDLGCGYTANYNANYIADVIDLSKFYKNKNHYDISNKTLTQILQHEKEFFDNLEVTKPEFCTFICPTLK